MTAYIFKINQSFLYRGSQKTITTIIFVEEFKRANLTKAIGIASQNPTIAALMKRSNWREKKLIEISRHKIADGLFIDNASF